MYIHSETINNQFKNYHLKDNHLFTVFLDGSGQTVVRTYEANSFNRENEIFLACKTFNIFLFTDNYVLAYFPLQRIVRIDLEAGNSTLIEGINLAPELIVNNYLLGISVDNLSNKILSRLNLETLELYTISKEPFRLWGTNGQDVYGVKIGLGRRIYSINPLNGTINWNHDFNTDLLGKVMPHGQIIIVPGKSKVFAVDVKYGKLLWERDSTNHLLQLFGDRIINVDSNYYREISPDTGETLVEYEMISEYEKHGFTVTGPLGAFTVTDTHVYIVHAMGCKMGCINRSTGIIDWSVRVGDGKVTLPHAPILSECRLYILDDEGTLHIFEKE